MNLTELNKEVANRLAKYPKHNRHLVEIKESNIPGAGLGLFAKEDIPKGIVIDYYYGKRLSGKEFRKLDGTATLYIVEINKNLYIDGDAEKNFVSFCNDARGLTRVPGLRNNCYFAIADDNKNMALCSSRNIKKGEEIFVFYGSSYWNAVKSFNTVQI